MDTVGDGTKHKRLKRDTVENIYRHCAATGTCPEDVKNKVEQTTIADRILKWIASIVYFGGLGISSGRGTGGSTGYIPLGGGGAGRVTPEGTVIRPGVIIDPIGPPDIVPVDVVTPESSSIVPLEVVPNITTTETPAVEVPDIGIVAEGDPISDITLDTTTPAVATIDPTSAVVEGQAVTPTTRRIAFNGSRHGSPSYISVYGHPTDPVSQATAEVFIGAAPDNGTVINIGESIPLDTFVQTEGSSTFSIEAPDTAPRSSTPKAFQKAFQKARDLYNRRVEQVRTRNVDFLSRPRQAVTFQFENPAFEDEVTLQFEQDLRQVAQAAPDSDFADVVHLSRPRYSETPEGTVRVSRLGRRGTIQTRSGLQIGSNVHFYYDISPIQTDVIEMQSFGVGTGSPIVGSADTAPILVPSTETSFIEGHTLVGPQDIAIDTLSDTTDTDFSSSRLALLGYADPTSPSVIPSLRIATLPPGTALQLLITAKNRVVPITAVSSNVSTHDIHVQPVTPAIVINGFEALPGFYLHPGLQRKRKRRWDDV
uniref:Minor capsid protein L2 n=1 Tax=Gammapapillomavirus 6 TaxID=1175848 RepID=A0A6H0QWZ8_9PAPI|nr:L2 [Gammapapillomavirus 6]